MRNFLTVMLMVATVAFFIVPNMGCPPPTPPTNGDGTNGDGTNGDGTNGDGTNGDGTNGDGTNGGGTTGLTIVKTAIPVRHDAKLLCGNDLIAFGTETAGATVGVSYIVPSTAPTVGTPVPNSELYSNKAFAVGGSTIFLAGINTASLAYQVSVYDVPTATMTQTFSTDEIRIGTTPVGAYDAGHIQADGNYCVVICDQSTVTDGVILKVIDVSSGTPTLIPLTNNPASTHFQVDQVAVDGTTGTVVAAANDTLYVYDIANPTAAPTEIAVANGIAENIQMAISGNYIIAVDDQGYTAAFLVDLSTNSVITMTDAECVRNPAISSTVFAFHSNNSAEDTQTRIAVGTVPGPGFTKPAADQYIDGSTPNNGSVGYGSDVAIRPSGSHIFLSGAYLQYSTSGVSFVVPADPGGTDPYGCPAWKVDCSSNTVGFQTAAVTTSGTPKTVGYIILP
ncbi:MAG: hypothetical protein JXA69_19900 [Phycisphaerae bacterium]|nr:hypothetical protein [Phycisphaerae bacterium]